MKLSVKQTKALDYLEDKETFELLFGGSAGGGKSFLGAYWLAKSALKYPGTRWLMGRAKLKTLKETTLNSFFDVCKIQGLKRDVHFKYNSQTGVISFINESEIILKDLFSYPSDPNFDELGSLEITGGFVDEANQVTSKAKQIVRSRIRYKLDDFLITGEKTINLRPTKFNKEGKPVEWFSDILNEKMEGLTPKMLMTCNPDKGWVFKEFYLPHANKTIESSKKFIQSLVSDNPYISETYVENLKQLDKASRERLLHGNWYYESNENQLITYEKVLDLYTNDHVKAIGNRYLSCDIAAQGDDNAVIMAWHGLNVVGVHSYSKLDPKVLESTIKSMATKYRVPQSNITFDSDGLGNYLRGYLRTAKPFNNGARPVSTGEKYRDFMNLKSQAYFKLADLINNGDISISAKGFNQEYLEEELTVMCDESYGTDKKKQVTPKEKAKEKLGRSPDFSDAMAYRMIFELKRDFSGRRRN